MSINDAGTPTGSSPTNSYLPPSNTSSTHGSSNSIPPMPPLPNPYRSDNSPDSEHGYPLPYPSPSSIYPPSTLIRPPPAVARISGKKKSQAVLGTGSVGIPIPPTSHPMTPPKEKPGML